MFRTYEDLLPILWTMVLAILYRDKIGLLCRCVQGDSNTAFRPPTRVSWITARYMVYFACSDIPEPWYIYGNTCWSAMEQPPAAKTTHCRFVCAAKLLCGGSYGLKRYSQWRWRVRGTASCSSKYQDMPACVQYRPYRTVLQREYTELSGSESSKVVSQSSRVPDVCESPVGAK